MKYIKVGAATLNQTPLDWSNNKNHIITAIKAASNEHISILCLPELCISGYGCEDTFLAPNTLKKSLQALQEIVSYTKGIMVAVGLPLLYQNRIYNTVSLLVDGKIAGFVAKRFLSNEGIHYESRWFHRWSSNIVAQIEIAGKFYPIGDIYFNCGGVRIGFEICEEAWIANRPGIKLAEQGIDIILNPSASHFAFGKHHIRERFVLEGSRAFSVNYIYTNLLGNEAGRAIYDGDMMIVAKGKLLATSKRFSFADYQLIHTLIDVELTRISQANTSYGVPNLENQIDLDFKYPKILSPLNKTNFLLEENTPSLKEEEFTHAVMLGLFDYLRKSHTQGFVVSLSGGADSSTIACLVYLMVKSAVKELGMEAFCHKIDYKFSTTTTITSLMQKLLLCVYQATENSSETTRNAAFTLAQRLEADYLELDVDKVVKDYLHIIANATQQKLTWEQHDIALQNIQARVRSPSVWLLANLRNALLLATSNRSEASQGYATMDGDTSGGLSPLAGIDKNFIRHWLRWLEQSSSAEFAPISELSLVNEQAPTAELRPKEMAQTDESDLMPYSVLNAIEKMAIRDRQTPYEILSLLQLQFSKYETAQLLIWVERFFNLWVRNQWKRERFAPGFHLDDESVDPKTWCRFPILSGGYMEEIAEMKATTFFQK
ncbi:MAG: NAD(+) synthase [Thiomargarita sp.]|nr:NAD(+) synthase [Thiomargarita sp.]